MNYKGLNIEVLPNEGEKGGFVAWITSPTGRILTFDKVQAHRIGTLIFSNAELARSEAIVMVETGAIQ